jgi:hypothetical protein
MNNNQAHKVYIKILRNMTPEERLKKSFELSELGKNLFREGLKRRFPELSEEELHKLYLERIEKCHNRNY